MPIFYIGVFLGNNNLPCELLNIENWRLHKGHHAIILYTPHVECNPWNGNLEIVSGRRKVADDHVI